MIWLLLVVYQIKHFVADYPLQGKYMLGKFKAYPEYIKPLLAHSAVHGVMTFLIALCVKPELALYLGIIDMVVHFIVDRIKASPDLLGRFKPLDAGNYQGVQSLSIGDFCGVPVAEEDKVGLISRAKTRLRSNVYFWWALGADQMAHHLTHYFLIWSMLK